MHNLFYIFTYLFSSSYIMSSFSIAILSILT
jgi:hypothetical protein